MTDWTDVDPQVPLLLLPVRIETQSESVPQDAPEDTPVRLRVRIYPDDVGLDPETGHPVLLPDAFVVLVRVDGLWLPACEGQPVDPDALRLGSAQGSAADRLDAAAATLRGLTRHDDDHGAWLWSYPAAEDAGMAVTVELPAGTARVDAVVVLGVRAGRDPDAEAAALDEALRAHGRDAGFLRAGDPTNNTEEGRSAWSRPAVTDAAERVAAPLEDTSAAARLSGALGTPAPLDDWPGADDPGERWAAAMATALWPVTWGSFLTRTVRPGVLDPDALEALRRHAADTVRGRGPLPVLRLGRQPYGVLPVTSTPEVSGHSREVDGLARVLERVGVLWRHGAAAVPSVTTGGVGALPEVLGQTPVSWGLRLRRLVGTGGPLAAAIAAGQDEQAEARRDLTGVLESILGAPGAFADPDLLGVDRTLGLPLVADDDHDALTALAESGTPGDGSVLQVLLSLALGTARAAVSDERVRALRDSLDGPLFELVGDEAASVARDVLEEVLDGRSAADHAAAALDLVDRRLEDQGRRARWTHPLARLDPAFRPDGVEGLLDELRTLLRAVVLWCDVRDAVATLAEVRAPEDRAALLAETLDCASHRLDAWVTSVATARLARLRGARRTGVAVGAFGVVEDLVVVRRTRPADVDAPVVVPAGPGGAVLAPSRTHAATAAVLRGGRLAHAPGDAADAADRALEMDLSSTRVREAEDVLAGMRAGLRLGALLGYRLERWLAASSLPLDRLVAPLRAMAPTVAATEVDRVAQGAVDLGLETVSASQVVDGLRLLEVPDVIQRLDQPPPALTRYAAEWPPLTAEEQTEVGRLVDRLRLLLDAVGDLLLAEGVHQVVSGNPTRAAAAMDALSGDGLPPDPDVSTAPRDRAGLSHRLLVLLPGSAPGPGHGWADTPRARANPALEGWCRTVLGPADHVVVAAPGGRTLTSLHVGALDLVESAGAGRVGLDAFWARARRAHPGQGEGPLTVRPEGLPDARSTLGEAWQLAAALRSLLDGSRALEPADLVHDPGSDPLRPTADLADAANTPDEVSAWQAWRLDLEHLADDLRGLAGTALAGTPLEVADRLAAFGIGAATTFKGEDDDDDLVAAHVAAGKVEAARRADRAAEHLTADATAEDLAAAARALTGSDLPVPVTLVAEGPPEPLAAAWDADDGSTRSGIRRWLARHARVRTAVRGYTEVAMLRAAAGRRAPLRAVTLGASAWLGEELPGGVAPADAHTSLVVEAVGGLHPGDSCAGLVLDGWHETLPRRRGVRDDTTSPPDPEAPEPEPAEVATAGLAVHADGPDARAPQLLLLGVSPDGGPWSEERVLGLVESTLQLARQRLVGLERLPLAGSVLPAVTVQHWSLQGERVLDPRVLSSLADPRATPRFVRFED